MAYTMINANSAKLCFIFKILIISETLILSVTAGENVIFGKCCQMRTDIIYITETQKKCSGLCKERPACTAYSFHRLSWFCRLHTEECLVETCVGSLHSKKENLDMTNFASCTCTEGQVCIKNEGITSFTCEIKECSPQREPTNGKILGNDFRVRRHIRYDCNAGHVLEGQIIRECQENGTWSGEEPSCNTVFTGCPVIGGLEWDQSCYFIVTNFGLKKNFADAATYCETDGGHVIHVTSQAEHDFITSNLVIPANIAATRYWIGIERNTADGIWYLSGSDIPIEFVAWASGEPTNGPSCAVYKYDSALSSWRWFTESCTDFPRYPLCEYD